MSDSFYKQVGQRIRIRRSLLGISKAALGKAVGKSGSQITRYENGESEMTALILRRIASVLEVPAEHFIKKVDPTITGSAFAEIPFKSKAKCSRDL